MIENFLGFVEHWGIWGIYFSMFVEGSAFPFVGSLFIVMVGNVLDLSWSNMIWISILGSLFYAIGSFIPYYIGFYIGDKLEAKLSEVKRKGFNKTKQTFTKYGIWSVAILSPLHLGNFVPFFAGMSKMKIKTYTVLTVLGMAPSTLLFLVIGRFFKGDVMGLMDQLNHFQFLFLILFAIIVVLVIFRKKQRIKLKKKECA